GAAGVAGGRARVLLQLVGVVAGDDLGHAVQVDVSDRAQRANAVPADLIDVLRRDALRAERLAGGRVVDAVSHYHLRALRVGQESRDGGATPPYRRRGLAGLRIAAVHPEEVAILVEGDEPAVLVRQGRIALVHVGCVPAAGHEADVPISFAIAGRDGGVPVHGADDVDGVPEVFRRAPERR